MVFNFVAVNIGFRSGVRSIKVYLTILEATIVVVFVVVYIIFGLLIVTSPIIFSCGKCLSWAPKG